MKDTGKSGGKVSAQRKRMRVRTTMLELVAGLMDRTQDEASLIGALKHIFAMADVRVVSSLAPVRLITKEPDAGARLRKAKTICA
jgi:hypothetical protein